MVLTASWMLFSLGIAHILFGFIKYRSPIKDAIVDGFVGKFGGSDSRRLAFWFTILGPALALIGQVAVHSVNIGDYEIVKTIGFYLLGISILGVLAFPKSPLWAVLLLAPIFIAGGFGWIH